jgi:hypothetical protein
MHPLRVESVAWITERKDVLSIFFGLIALLAYVRYSRAPRFPRYLLICATYALSLMAKPLFVTLPLLLLLLDYWPLARAPQLKSWPKLLLEKLPLFALAFAASLMTFFFVIVHPPSDAVRNIFPLSLRLQNAVLMLALSLRDTFYFGRLSLFYPQLPAIPPAQLLASAGLLFVLAGCALLLLRKRPDLGRPVIMGLLWFLVALLPVLNIVQAGEQSRADRFSYLPSIGLFIAIVWPFAAISPRAIPAHLWANLRIVLAAAIVLTLTLFTALRIDLWRRPLALYLDGIANTGDNWFLERCSAAALLERAAKITNPATRQQLYQQALLHEQRTLDLHPDGYQHNNVGVALALTGRLPEAYEHFRIAHQLLPNDPSIASNYTHTRDALQQPASH